MRWGGTCWASPRARWPSKQSQAAAAVGQISLAGAYQAAFKAHGLTAAQILLTLGDTEERRRYLNARQTIATLLAQRAVPVVDADRRADPRPLGARADGDDGLALPAPLDVEEVLDADRHPDIAEQRTQKLSGGADPAGALRVALVCNPDLLVLDEPTVAMDVEGRHAFWRAMREFAARGKTILFATHYLEEADANADRAVLMAHGRIVADGPTTEIKAMVGTRTIRATLPDVPTRRARARCPA